MEQLNVGELITLLQCTDPFRLVLVEGCDDVGDCIGISLGEDYVEIRREGGSSQEIPLTPDSPEIK